MNRRAKFLTGILVGLTVAGAVVIAAWMSCGELLALSAGITVGGLGVGAWFLAHPDAARAWPEEDAS